MKIFELFSEQTIGTTGSSAGPVTTVSPVSQKPSDRPATDTSTKPTQPQPEDPNQKNLMNLLKQNQINVKSTDDFLRAFTAIQQRQPLNNMPPEQQRAITDYTKATLNKPGLPTQMATMMKSLMKNNPQTPAQPVK